MFICTCDQHCIINNEDDFNLHYRDSKTHHHNGSVICFACNTGFTYFRAFKSHFKKQHRDKAIGVILNQSNLLNEQQANSFNNNLANNPAARLIYRPIASNIASFNFASTSFNSPTTAPPILESSPMQVDYDDLDSLDVSDNDATAADATADSEQQDFEDQFDQLDDIFSDSLPSNEFNPTNTNVEDDYLNLLIKIKSNRPEMTLEALKYAALELNEFYKEKFHRLQLDNNSFADFGKIAKAKKFKKKITTMVEQYPIPGKFTKDNKQVMAKCYYRSLSETFENYLSNDVIRKELWKEKMRPKYDDKIQNVNDLDNVKALWSTLGENEVLALYKVYFDDINVSFSKKINTKLSVVQVNLINIDYKFQTSRKSNQMIAITKRSTIDLIGLKQFFDNIINQIKNLDQLQIDGINYHLKLFCAVGDNLALNEMEGDANRNFCYDCCRRCVATTSEMNENLCFEDYYRDCNKRNLTISHLFHGVEFVAPECYAPDLMHNGPLGAYEKLLDALFTKHKVDVDAFNHSLEISSNFFTYRTSLSDVRIKKASGIISFTQSATAAQKQLLFELFPFFNNFIDVQSIDFELYVKLRDISSFISNSPILKEDLDPFQIKVHEYLRGFKDQFSSFNITPKMHYFVHFKDDTLSFGPLESCSTISFERTHQPIKQTVQSTKNYINLPATINSLFNFDLEEAFSEQNQIKKQINLSQIEVQYLRFLSNIDRNTVIDDLKMTTIDTVKFKLARYYLYKIRGSNGYPVFFKINRILKIGDKKFIFGNYYYAVCWWKKFYSFEVVSNDQLILMDIKQLESTKELYYLTYKLDRFTAKNFIIKNFHINYSIFNMYRDTQL